MQLEQQRRYARQIMLADIGESGQQKLLHARVLVIGAGGLGSALITYLAAAGVGHIGIIDDDRVELSNLARQILHETGDIGRLKVESASDRIAELNPDVTVTTYPFALTAENATAIIGGRISRALASSPLEGESKSPLSDFGGGTTARIKSPHQNPLTGFGSPLRGEREQASPPQPHQPYDIIADGCDNFETRFLVNATCIALQKPLVSAAITGWQGQVMTIAPHLAPGTGCYQCFASPDAPEANTCRESGIIGPLAGIIGSMQALEVIHTILGRPALIGKLARYDAHTMAQRISTTTPDPTCPVCGAMDRPAMAVL